MRWNPAGKANQGSAGTEEDSLNVEWHQCKTPRTGETTLLARAAESVRRAKRDVRSKPTDNPRSQSGRLRGAKAEVDQTQIPVVDLSSKKLPGARFAVLRTSRSNPVAGTEAPLPDAHLDAAWRPSNQSSSWRLRAALRFPARRFERRRRSDPPPACRPIAEHMHLSGDPSCCGPASRAAGAKVGKNRQFAWCRRMLDDKRRILSEISKLKGAGFFMEPRKARRWGLTATSNP